MTQAFFSRKWMTVSLSKILAPYDICVIDIGSPKLGNLGWCYLEAAAQQEHTGFHLDDLFPHIHNGVSTHGLILGLEAPLFVPIRPDLMLATKARKGEARRPWSAGAGAQVLALNLPIMVYLFQGIQALFPDISWHLNETSFSAKANEIMIFEALVSGSDKGTSHINDAQIMAQYCQGFSENKILPLSILEHEERTEFFNLAAAALLRSSANLSSDALHAQTPIYKPGMM